MTNTNAKMTPIVKYEPDFNMVHRTHFVNLLALLFSSSVCMGGNRMDVNMFHIYCSSPYNFKAVFCLKTDSSNRVWAGRKTKMKSHTAEVRNTAVLATICSKMSSINEKQMIYNPQVHMGKALVWVSNWLQVWYS
jgi:hypothetical protein